jgi:hypothetical protein
MTNDLVLAQSHAFQLARTLMVPVTVFQIEGAYGVLPSDEIDDADELRIIHEFDPHDRRPAH